jgi:hypothetical protein
MTRAHIITRYPAPCYYQHIGKLSAEGAVIYGPHLDMGDTLEALRDPLGMARKFAHAMAQEMGEPFAWGWYDHPEGLRPAVCALEMVPRGFFTDGQTGAKVAA